MKHILDQKILKKWGFKWAQTEKDTVISYVIDNTSHTDMFLGDPVMLAMYPDPNTGVKWYLTALGGKNTQDRVLFSGQIPSWKDLDCILKCTLIFKPNHGNSSKLREKGDSGKGTV